MRLPRERRIRASADFTRLRNLGSRLDCGPFLLNYKVEEGEGLSRFAVIAAKKTFPLAVQRNRVKRLARSIFRSQGELFPKGTALVLVARASMLRRRFADLEKTLALAAQRIQERQGPEVA